MLSRFFSLSGLVLLPPFHVRVGTTGLAHFIWSLEGRMGKVPADAEHPCARSEAPPPLAWTGAGSYSQGDFLESSPTTGRPVN